MEHRLWHAAYPAGLPRNVILDEQETLATLLERAFTKHAARTAVTCAGESLTFAQVEHASALVARALQAAGLQRGDRVALLLHNNLIYPVALAAILRAGMVGVTMNPLYTARELAYQLADSGASALVAAEPFMGVVTEVLGQTQVRYVMTVPMQEVKQALFATASDASATVLSDGPRVVSLRDATAALRDADFASEQMRPSDLAFLQYTGGTTGVSKGACLTHRSVLASSLQMRSWLGLALDIDDFEIVTPLPLYHIFPLGTTLTALASGAHNRLVVNPRDAQALCAELKRAPFDMLIGVNTMFNAMVTLPELSGIDFSRCNVVIGAGASIQAAVAAKWVAAGGPPITEAYGLTETSPSVTFNAPGRNGTIGAPVPSTDVLIVDDAGDPVPLGTPGELLIKGPQVFAGYWNREDETRRSFTQDGWFRTGDIVTMDAKGLMYIVDRKKDMILVSGFNVYPNEIEGVVAMHPDVLECACVGVPDERSAEAPHLFVVRRVPGLGAEELEAHCRKLLAAYKVPRHITFLESLPKSAVGKILRKELRPISNSATDAAPKVEVGR
ncbi:long-chain fatty acid--CoA ligase [Variovorax beijingensis]|uniref:Long-chain-fatty-acid--CoA ligase n=1 Tax=Variovorax beijingensis TaxID=2496117 RepID=A0A3P3EMZ2_9BURK|nr:AMP-binding protein [Variovorax beijingensis]RRH87561.1 long-chain fatty acid--CoA ligase [Variovorax beijingensis]